MKKKTYKNHDLHRGWNTGGGVVQPIFIATKHRTSSMQLQIGCTGPISATTKCRAQGDWNRKIIQDMHYKKPCT